MKSGKSIAGAESAMEEREITDSWPVDMRKALFPQVWRMDTDLYLRWVHETYYDPNNRVARFFETDGWEWLSRTSWYTIPLTWCPVIAAVLAYTAPSQLWHETLALVGAGIFLWMLTEYSLHRWLFHIDDFFLPDHWIARTLHFALHGVHHKVPMDPYRLVFPPVMAAPIAIVMYGILMTTLGNVIPYHAILTLYAGFGVGYVGYDMFHYASHHADLSWSSYLYDMKRYHMKHHNVEGPSRGFGITSKLFDHVFGTALDLPPVRKHAR